MKLINFIERGRGGQQKEVIVTIPAFTHFFSVAVICTSKLLPDLLKFGHHAMFSL